MGLSFIFSEIIGRFIREFKGSVDWDCISKYQKLSEDFIREFKDSVNWFNISYSQKLSEDFIREFKGSVALGLYLNISEIIGRFYPRI